MAFHDSIVGRRILLTLMLPTSLARPAEEPIADFSRAIVFAPAGSSVREMKAVEMLVDEVAKRGQMARWEIAREWPREARAVIAIGREPTLTGSSAQIGAAFAAGDAARPAEGYTLRVATNGSAPHALVLGNDERGVLFGVGRLLRSSQIERGRVGIASNLGVTTAPHYRLRGHQLGYRPKTNSYDGWDLPLWEQYIRDLAVFGTNAVELLPPRTDDDADSPHFPLPPLAMMKGMSKILDDYGLDVWIWYPALDADYSNPATVDAALKEWGDVFSVLPRIDAVFVPGGDPGHTQPRHLMALLEKETQVLRQHHPKAEMWLSPQGFNQAWMDEFIGILSTEQPLWLTGVVFGPQVPGTLAQLRKAVPARYPIRHYPDITHTRQCQYPVPDWDVAFALTQDRECVNPRPLGEANIFRRIQGPSIGFISYSEGCNDDVNKIIWSSLGWNPDADVREVLLEYARYFIGASLAETFADGLLGLERNWTGPLRSNDEVAKTLELFQRVERTASPAQLKSWRLQQGLYRAYYDAYVQSRLRHEVSIEEEAMARLIEAPKVGSLAAISRASEILERTVTERVSQPWRARVFELAEALFQSIHMQLSVGRYKAIDVGRGANLDTIDVTLNNYFWLKRQLAEIQELDGETERLRALDSIVHRTDPGPGGFYDDLGDPSRQPHLVRGPGFELDPALLESMSVGFADQPEGPRAWWHHAQSLQDAPLQMRYTGLDPRARYKIRVVYGGETPLIPIRLVAGDGIEVHPLIKKEKPIRPVEFEIPPRATAQGELMLTWTRPLGLGRNGRGCQVSEVWLIRE